jgi:hypothetical protein
MKESMKQYAKYWLCAIILFLSNGSFAQEVQMADTFRSEGKIYVVVAIILIVLAGLIIYLFSLDRKLTKIEKQIGGKHQTK